MESIYLFFLLWAQSGTMPETAHSYVEIYEKGIANKCPVVLMGYNDVVLSISWKVFERKVIKKKIVSWGTETNIAALL